MDNDDLVRASDIKAAREVAQRMRRYSMLAAILGGILFSLVCAALMYFAQTDRHVGAAAVVDSLTLLFFGLPLSVHWWRHYKSVFKQLDLVERRVAAGESVYGSQLLFHRRAV